MSLLGWSEMPIISQPR